MELPVGALKTRVVTDEDELREQVALAGRILHQQGLLDYLGHCSARVPGSERIIIKPKHSRDVRGFHALGPDDMVVIDLAGELVEGDAQPPAERFIHTEIYRARPDVTAVVHTHQPHGTTLGVIGAALKPVLHVPSVLADRGRIASWPCPLLVTDPAMGREVAETLGDGRLCHLVGHGIVSVADDVRLATLAAIAVEQLAQANLTILGTGLEPRVITEDELDTLERTLATVDGRWAYHAQLVEEGGRGVA
jgi:ribulose-5-phosphate 4-epimerase/fuculose-1-phosphate aldolase